MSWMEGEKKQKRWAHAGINSGARGREEERKKEKNTLPPQSPPANQHAEELVYLETEESVCSDMTSSAAHERRGHFFFTSPNFFSLQLGGCGRKYDAVVHTKWSRPQASTSQLSFVLTQDCSHKRNGFSRVLVFFSEKKKITRLNHPNAILPWQSWVSVVRLWDRHHS